MEEINNSFKSLQINSKDKKIRFIDLFAGTGGFSLSFKKHDRFECVFANDIEVNSKKIYELNNPAHMFVLEDLNELDINKIPLFDMLCAGFPCQPFSIAGRRKGFEDSRTNVFWKILKILDKFEPEIILLENVKNLKTHDDGNTFSTIENKLKELGYHIKSSIIDTCKITSIPHHRERIYIIGFKNKKLYDSFDFNFTPVPNDKILTYLESSVPSKYYYSNRFKVYEEIEKNITKNISSNIIYQYRRYYVRENKNNCCPTLTANMGSGGHNVPLLKDDIGIRKLTPRECFNLQGFPVDYNFPKISDGALYKLAGNAISVPVVELIIKKLNNII